MKMHGEFILEIENGKNVHPVDLMLHLFDFRALKSVQPFRLKSIGIPESSNWSIKILFWLIEVFIYLHSIIFIANAYFLIVALIFLSRVLTRLFKRLINTQTPCSNFYWEAGRSVDCFSMFSCVAIIITPLYFFVSYLVPLEVNAFVCFYKNIDTVFLTIVQYAIYAK